MASRKKVEELSMVSVDKTAQTKLELSLKLQDEQEARATMVAYLGLVCARQDWHGVMDAAADLREIDARISTLEVIVGKLA